MIIEFAWILEGLLSVIIAGLIYYITDLSKRISALEKDIIELKLNYISRFETASHDRNEQKEELLAAISELTIANEKSHAKLMETIMKGTR